MHILKLSFLLSLMLFISCDDGDIIESNFDFETDNLEFCFSENDDRTVFFNYNSDNNEVLYAIINDEFDGVEEFDNSTSAESYSVGDTDNIVKYIKFDADIDTEEYFCSAIGSVETINRELSGTAGTIDILTINEIDNDSDPNETDADEDGDGLSNVDEGYDGVAVTEDELDNLQDTDGDGIPDFRDEDDDNDNVPTSEELYVKDDEGNDIDEDDDGNPITEYLDTDIDGIPDYLDSDDDDDGIQTRLEYITDGVSILPTAESNSVGGIPRYLLSEFATAGNQTEDIIITNSYTTNFNTVVKVLNLELDDSSGSTTTYDVLVIGEETTSSTVEHTVHILVDNTFEVFNITDREDVESANPIETGDLIETDPSPTDPNTPDPSGN